MTLTPSTQQNVIRRIPDNTATTGPSGVGPDERTTPSAPTVVGGALLAVGVVLTAANLRPAVTSLSAVLTEARTALDASPAWASLVTAIPTLCFGLVGLVAPWLQQRIGSRRSITLALLLLTAGLAVRVLGGAGLLVVGTFLACSAIAVCNVLIPVVVKESFPHRLGLLTGVYGAMVATGGAGAAALTAPLRDATGSWRAAAGSWALLGAVALVVWFVAARRTRGTWPSDEATVENDSMVDLLRRPLAWAVTLFFGLQSLLSYTVMGWLPEILQDVAGVDAVTAGVMLAALMLLGVPLTMVVPPLAARRRSQVGWTTAIGVSGLLGVLGLLVAPTTATWLWIVLIGVGMSMFSLALTIIGLRAGNGAQTAALSAMAQSLGYLVAATGPFLTGVLHAVTGGWTGSLVFLVLTVAAQVVFGAVAGRPHRL